MTNAATRTRTIVDRAGATTGGVAHDLGPGDVLAVPAGVPHQFTAATDPFLYFVVKVGS